MPGPSLIQHEMTQAGAELSQAQVGIKFVKIYHGLHVFCFVWTWLVLFYTDWQIGFWHACACTALTKSNLETRRKSPMDIVQPWFNLKLV